MAHSIHIAEYISSVEMFRFCDNVLSVIIRHYQRPVRVPTCFVPFTDEKRLSSSIRVRAKLSCHHNSVHYLQWRF